MQFPRTHRVLFAAMLAVAPLAALLTVATTPAPAAAATCSVPGNAVHVARSGSDGSGTGSAARPYRTIQHAVDRTGSNETIVIHGGDYRESVLIRGSARRLIAAPGETVWITGSDGISGWTSAGSGRWRSTSAPAAGLDATSAFRQAGMLGGNQLAGHLAEVWLDGRELRQVASAASVDANSFFVDSSGRVTVGTNPSGHFVEVSRRSTGLVLDNASGSVVEGIGFRRHATRFNERAAVRVDEGSHRVTIRRSRFSDNANVGLQILGRDVVLEDSEFLRNGRMGLNAHHADRLLVQRSLFANNNDQGFSGGGAAGGLKITASRDINIRSNRVLDNDAHAIWIDVSVLRANVISNHTENNSGYGVHVEVSADVLVASNSSVNDERGIQISESNNIQVWNNVVIGGAPAISALDHDRDAATADPGSNGFAAPFDDRYGNVSQITWNTHDIAIRNNVMARGTQSDSMLFVHDVQRRTSADDMNVRVDHNLFHRSSTSSPRWVVGWGDWPSGMVALETVSAWRARSGSNGAGSIETTGALTAVRNDANDLRVRSNGPAAGSGVTVPTWIADRVGAGGRDIGLLVRPPTTTGVTNCPSAPTPTTTRPANTTTTRPATTTTRPTNTTTTRPATTTPTTTTVRPADPSGQLGGTQPLGSDQFVDVVEGAFYDEAVGWLIETGATNGVTRTRFAPLVPTTRGEVATFLWRLAGEPSGSRGSDRFDDVVPGAFYDEAIGWLVDSGATTGTSATTFSPQDFSGRGQLATFLWRLEGEPRASAGSSRFGDVTRGAFYDEAIGWLVDTGATNGTSTSTFSPDALSTRGEFATLLWRMS